MKKRCYVHNVVMDLITFHKNLQTTSGLSILLHGFISLTDATSYDKATYKKSGWSIVYIEES